METPEITPCDKCKREYPSRQLTHCTTCFTKTCLRCQCELTGGLHSHIHDCFTFPRNPGVAFEALYTPSLAALSPRRGLTHPVPRPFTMLLDSTWLHDRPAEDTYRLLIDSYRLRAHDAFLFEGDTRPGTIYSGYGDSRSGLWEYINAAQGKDLLPRWWTAQTQQACEELGMAHCHFHSLREPLSQAMVVDYYQDATFPTQLRLFAEDVQGRGTCLRSCRDALGALVDMEEEEAGGTRIFDWNAYNTAFVNQNWDRPRRFEEGDV